MRKHGPCRQNTIGTTPARSGGRCPVQTPPTAATAWSVREAEPRQSHRNRLRSRGGRPRNGGPARCSRRGSAGQAGSLPGRSTEDWTCRARRGRAPRGVSLPTTAVPRCTLRTPIFPLRTFRQKGTPRASDTHLRFSHVSATRSTPTSARYKKIQEQERPPTSAQSRAICAGQEACYRTKQEAQPMTPVLSPPPPRTKRMVACHSSYSG